MTQLSVAAKQWGEKPTTSARSVLVTILGDTVAPLGGEVWLSDLFELVQPFGFNERLVRTSMFRLMNENWLENERIGRRSRYRLTPYADLEFADADRRIYQRDPPTWDGEWSLVLTDTALAAHGTEQRRLAQHLRWHGFVEIGRNVWAIPERDLTITNELVDRLGLGARPPVALARFDRLDDLVEGGLFRSSFALGETEQAYRGFIKRYEHMDNGDHVEATPMEAFALRTMVVHDLRRARLSDPDLPSALLPDGWIGIEAFELAARLYRQIDDRAWVAVEAATDLDPERGDSRLKDRFKAV
jgi:phenylacetic acid degradation operon negative regulatory protein